MRELGDDILLLAIRSNGSLGAASFLRIAVSGTQLIRLAAERRIEIVDKRITVLDPGSTGDALLDAALADIAAAGGPRARSWVGKDRRGLVKGHLQQLAERGVVRPEDYKALGLFSRTRWHVVDVLRVQQARARLDAVVGAAGPLDSEQYALGTVVRAVTLDKVLFPGREGRPVRLRLERLARAGIRGTGEADGIRRADGDPALERSVDVAIKACLQAAKARAQELASAAGG